MSDKTELQQQIFSLLEEDLDRASSEIAEELNCSESYVRDLRKKYLPELYGENNILEYNVNISFSSPRSILISDQVHEELGVDNLPYAEIAMENIDGEIENYSVELDNIENIDIEQEVICWSYILEHFGGDISQDLPWECSEFVDSSSNEFQMYDSEELKEFLDQLEKWISADRESADIYIGIQILREGIDRENIDRDIVNTPQFSSSAESILDIFEKASPPRVIDIRGTSGETHTPQTNYFLCRNISDNVNLEALRQDILSLNYIDPEFDFTFGRKVQATGPQLLESHNDNIIGISEDNIELIEQKIGYTTVPPNKEIDYAVLDEITSDIKVSPPDSDDEIKIGKETHFDHDDRKVIILSFNTVTLTITIVPDQNIIFWFFPDIQFIKKTVERLQSLLSERINIGSELTYMNTGGAIPETEVLILDTNAIYHEILDNEPSSILRSLFPMKGYEFYQSEIVIPWSTRYEINKHKDEGGPEPRVQQKGIDNLKSLKILNQYEFIDLTIENIPDNIMSQISQSHVADMDLLESAERGDDTVLITGDERLRELARISDTRTMDIYDLAKIDKNPNIDEELDKIKTDIGEGLLTFNEIKTEIESVPENQIEYKGIDSVENPEEYIQNWINAGEIIRYYNSDKDRVEYSTAIEEDIVISPTAANLLVEHIAKDSDGRSLLTEECLEKLRKVLNLHSDQYPKVTFRVPVSSVISPERTSLGGISTEAKNFHKINKISNAEYSTSQLKESNSNHRYVHDSVLLAKENSYPILCAGEEDFLIKIASLLGISAEKLN